MKPQPAKDTSLSSKLSTMTVRSLYHLLSSSIASEASIWAIISYSQMTGNVKAAFWNVRPDGTFTDIDRVGVGPRFSLAYFLVIRLRRIDVIETQRGIAN